MEPIKFDENNKMFGESQEDYGTLPVSIVDNHFISCWRLGFWERLKVLFFGHIFLTILGLQPPVSLSVADMGKFDEVIK